MSAGRQNIQGQNAAERLSWCEKERPMKRGLLFLIPMLGWSILPVNAGAQEPFGIIAAEPNPCRIEPGEKECTAHITWTTQNVTRAKVFVKQENREGVKENEFGSSLACESRRCRAPWIRPDTRYVFKLYDMSSGDRGRELSSVTVTARRER
jgi:hypothetical protein